MTPADDRVALSTVRRAVGDWVTPDAEARRAAMDLLDRLDGPEAVPAPWIERTHLVQVVRRRAAHPAGVKGVVELLARLEAHSEARVRLVSIETTGTVLHLYTSYDLREVLGCILGADRRQVPVIKAPMPCRVRFRTPGEGGRRNGAPAGPTYAATATRSSGVEAPDVSASFSIVLELEVGRARTGDWSRATVRALVEGAPGSEALRPGARLLVLEGARVVGDIEVGTVPRREHLQH